MTSETQISNHSENSATPAWPFILLTMTCLIWAGMVMGISLLETPIKFTAPSLKQAVAPEIGRAIALDIGRVVFGAFNKVEIVWSLLTLVLLFGAGIFRRLSAITKGLFIGLWAVVAFQSIVLVPALAERAQMVLNKQTLPPAPYHMLYTSTELFKLIALLTLGVMLLKLNSRSQA
jgi:hypothetical protein